MQHDKTTKVRWIIEIEFDDKVEAYRHCQEIGRLMESMGETGTLTLRGEPNGDDTPKPPQMQSDQPHSASTGDTVHRVLAERARCAAIVRAKKRLFPYMVDVRNELEKTALEIERCGKTQIPIEPTEKEVTQDARSELANYLLSTDYRRLLYRALLSRYGTSQAHKAEHERAIHLFEAAFPEVRAYDQS